ncbi:ATP synthase F0 subunit C [Hydrogenobaculum sp.]
MKLKTLMLLTLASSIAMADTAGSSGSDAHARALFYGLMAIAVGVSIGLGALGAGVGAGSAIRGAEEGMARNPNMAGKLQTIMFIGLAFIETFVLYAMLFSIIFVFTGIFSGKAGF